MPAAHISMFERGGGGGGGVTRLSSGNASVGGGSSDMGALSTSAEEAAGTVLAPVAAVAGTAAGGGGGGGAGAAGAGGGAAVAAVAVAAAAGGGVVSHSEMVTPPSLRGAVRIIRDRLYYASFKSRPPSSPRSGGGSSLSSASPPVHYFSVDEELVYWNFFLDFGPLNLGQLCRFCRKLNDKLDDPRLSDRPICFYSGTASFRRANAIFLVCAWQVLYLGRTPEEAFWGFRPADASSGSASASASASLDKNGNCSLPPVALVAGNRSLRHGSFSLRGQSSDGTGSGTATATAAAAATTTTAPLPPFHDASPCQCTYDLTVLDCLRGLAKARSYGFFDFEDDFDVDEYEHFEQVENGDLNWIIRGKVLAFAGPHYRRQITPEGYCTLTPAEYIPYFRKKGVSLVVRLNKKCYDEKDFLNAGFDFVEQYYLDGSCPPMKILQRVLAAFESVPLDKAFAVHCKAGLGRTGTCIGAYLMKHYKFTAAEAIGYMRICRPGMVIGPQQHFLKDIESRMWSEGDAMRAAEAEAAAAAAAAAAAETEAAAVAAAAAAAAAAASARATTRTPVAIKTGGGSNGNKLFGFGMALDQTSPTAVTNLPFETLSVGESMDADEGGEGLEVEGLTVASGTEKGEDMSEEGEMDGGPAAEAIYGRPGQANALLARRTHLQHLHSAGTSSSLIDSGGGREKGDKAGGHLSAQELRGR